MSADRQAGVSLAELLIALTILLIVASGALTTYDNSVDAFKQGGVAAEQQQGVRSAFEKIGEDIRMTGFNYDPDNDPDRNDEQIEAAYDTAIVIRADFDGDDPVLSLVPEVALAGGADFEIVTTGNDEIVAYVLAKPDWSGGSQMHFCADMDDPQRDGMSESTFLSNAAMVQNNPPYTLYRVTLSNDVSDWGSYEFFDRTVLAENIGWLTFRYFDAAGNQMNSFDLNSPSDDIGGQDAQAALRRKIRRVEVDLAGLARDTDPSWVDWSDPNPATRPYRKFQLTGDFRLRNAGATGIEDTGGTGFGSL